MTSFRRRIRAWFNRKTVKRRIRQFVRALASLLAVFLGAAIGIGVVFPGMKGPGSGRSVEIILPKGETLDSLVTRLTSSGLIEYPFLFGLYARKENLQSLAVSGLHFLTDDLSPRDLVSLLERRASAPKAYVTIPEGFTIFDIAKRMQSSNVCSASAWLSASRDVALLAELKIPGGSAEGYLFPSKYEFVRDSDAADTIRKMKGEFDRRYSRIEAQVESRGDSHWGMREIVILASIIEKEAVVDDERPIIASVFLNRLRDPSFRRKVLQSDPTSGYGCLVMGDMLPACANYSGKITHDINSDSHNPYSTYTHEGLPPGPISNPGEKSMDAVLLPAATRYLYFVAKGGGRHTFSETFAEHRSAIHARP